MIIIAILIVISILFIIAWLSEPGPLPQDKNSILAPCPDKPNCVCSEYIDDTEHYIAPLSLLFKTIIQEQLNYIKISVQSLGGENSKLMRILPTWLQLSPPPSLALLTMSSSGVDTRKSTRSHSLSSSPRSQ